MCVYFSFVEGYIVNGIPHMNIHQVRILWLLLCHVHACTLFIILVMTEKSLLVVHHV